MSVESHCWAVGDGLQGVNAFEVAGGVVGPVTPSDAFHAGVIEGNTSGVGDLAALASAPTALILGGGTWRLRAAVRVPTASTPGNRFVVRVGFGNDADADPTRGVFFIYSDSINGGNWQGVVRTGSGDVTVPSGKSGTEWRTLEIMVDAQRNVTFAVDGIRLSTTPTASTDPIGLLPLQVERSTSEAGDSCSGEIDYYKYEFRPTTEGEFFPE